jgi:hypothetical protein
MLNKNVKNTAVWSQLTFPNFLIAPHSFTTTFVNITFLLVALTSPDLSYLLVLTAASSWLFY